VIIALGGGATSLHALTQATPPEAPKPAASKVAVSDRLDDTFRKYSKRFFGPGVDWRLFKAQGLAESGLNPDAVSRVGARGIMQLMPSTYQEVRSKSALIGEHINDPEWNIAAGIMYDRMLWKSWTSALDDSHRFQFVFGSYNAGMSYVQKAQKIAQDRELDWRIWPSIEVVAPHVPRWRSEETITYVQRILQFLERMNANGKLTRK
jgi:membrane-bound lytic murein transglycosylase F